MLVRTRSDAQLRAEVLALRHQLRVLERKVGKPAWLAADPTLNSAALAQLVWEQFGLRVHRRSVERAL